MPTDALGSVRGIADGNGAPVDTADCDVFGAVRSQNGASGLFSYTGEQVDGGRVTYLPARYLSPALGRFLSVDTVQPNATGSQRYSRYAYVASNPTTWVDSSGHSVATGVADVA